MKVAGNLGGPPRLEGGVLPNRFFFAFFLLFFWLFFCIFLLFLRFFPRKKPKKKRFLTPPPPTIPPARSRGRVSQGVGPPSPGPGVGSARRLDPLLGMSGPAECAGLFPLSPALFPLVLAFLVAIACRFHCFPGFLLVFFDFFAFSNRLFWPFFPIAFYLLFLLFFAFFSGVFFAFFLFFFLLFQIVFFFCFFSLFFKKKRFTEVSLYSRQHNHTC